MQKGIFVGLFACASALALGACGEQQQPAPPPPAVGVVKLTVENAPLTTELPGRIAAVETAEVRPQISGVIRRRLFTEGAVVRAGQLLYEIEDAPYRAALGQAQGALSRAQASIRATGLQAQRYKELVGINAVSRQEADNAAASAQQARADVAAQRAAVQAAQVNQDFTRIRAPISGRIGRSLFTPGALVQAGQADPLATIQRTDVVYVDVTQSAAQIIDLKQAMKAGGVSAADGARVQLLLPNGSVYPIEGRLQFSEVTVDPSSGAVTLRATFANPDGLLLPGMYVRARLVEGQRSQAILAPQQGITRDARGRATAMVVGADNKVELRQVETDRAIGDKWIVTKGLKAGDRLVVEGLVNLRPGTVVKPGAPQQVTAGRQANAGGAN
ncbi:MULTISPECIES: efflux RND transporter periplasmic adaptor subunit [Sphingobium]|jgi:membrane fusion protein (multidrug efflux system)|uniref:Efflux RND transporter periplasmic adaptor subunit n=2 Tax=Sphingobium fuliginis (strain ATCC 27551) TaxID=336203 RepID=A0A292ZEA8_SPHSA|nr:MULTISPECIES: efflux RND transporter periplasmic adaptor subunit [Sphingobium]PNQ01483.1 efflux transporter periplasmic adaptor subunit [Sphingobium sp. SA916]QDC37333.1 efflux RND transporter periplasmic adaptor subunit [Sphingobium fuliginis ATCC 27551]QOT72784.1 efflux RND transporter periplasmic adaptor subunit [Sphingobium fuliginis]GAY21189.1 RND efflux system, membrane fusion protein CmeA [Sphingobium fuliginis]